MRGGGGRFLGTKLKSSIPISFSACWQPYFLHVKFEIKAEIPKYKKLLGKG